MEKQLPKNWVECSLGIVAEVTSGYGFPLKYQGFTDLEIPFFKVGDISENFKKGNIFLKTSNNFISEEILKSIKAKKLSSESIVFAKIGEAIRLNRRAIVSEDCVVDNNVMALKFNKSVDFKYGYYFFQTVKLIDLSAGNAVPSIRKSVVENLVFPLPPLAEQNRIVEKLDTLFAQLEIIKTSMAGIPVLLKNFRQQVLTQAVTGKLTESWRVGKELEKIKLVNLKNDVEYSILDFSSIPKSWKITALGNYAICSRGKFTPRPRNDPRYFNGDYPFMQIGDLPREGGITSSYSKTLNELGKGISKSFEKNTIVIAIVGATIGNTGILSKEMFFPDSLIGINCSDEISNIYFEYFLRVCKNGLREISYSSGGQPNINTQVIKNLEVAIPPLKEQQEIVSRVESLFAKADAIEKQYQTLKEKIDHLLQGILHKAFKGELTEQLESDGDARDLLKEIEALKSTTVKVKKVKKVSKVEKRNKKVEAI